jgi:hypothetical protein
MRIDPHPRNPATLQKNVPDFSPPIRPAVADEGSSQQTLCSRNADRRKNPEISWLSVDYCQTLSRQLFRHVPIYNKADPSVALPVTLNNLLMKVYVRSEQRALDLKFV